MGVTCTVCLLRKSSYNRLFLVLSGKRNRRQLTRGNWGCKQCFFRWYSSLHYWSAIEAFVNKMIREQKPSTSHYYDIWHVARSIQKVLLNLSKEKGWERIAKIMKAVRTHLYWCATSIKEGFEELIIAKGSHSWIMSLTTWKPLWSPI